MFSSQLGTFCPREMTFCIDSIKLNNCEPKSVKFWLNVLIDNQMTTVKKSVSYPDLCQDLKNLNTMKCFPTNEES